MAKETYFLKSINNEIKSVHIVSRPYPFTEKDAYRQSLSYDAFKNNEAKRLIKNQEKEDELYYLNYSQKQFEKEKSFLNDVPIYTHNSIWDFYQEIGYNYKSKKYI